MMVAPVITLLVGAVTMMVLVIICREGVDGDE